MVGAFCCTFIPDNDATHANITLALDRMRKVNLKLKKDEQGMENFDTKEVEPESNFTIVVMV